MKKASTIKYITPRTVAEACSLLSEYGSAARLVAGGTDLLLSLKNREIEPQYLLNLDSVAELSYIRYDGKYLRIGALTTISDLGSSPDIKQHFPILADAAGAMGSPQIRNMATVIGNLCRAAPSADMAPALMALGAEIKIVHAGGERVIALEDFFTGPGESVLDSNEIATEVRVKAASSCIKGIYLRISRREAVSIAFAGVAVAVKLDSAQSKIEDIKIVLGAVASTPLRAVKAEEILKGERVGDSLIEKAAAAAAEAADPITDIRCTAEYRSEMIKVLVNRALRKALLST